MLVKYTTINIIYQSWFIFNISFINEISTVTHTKLLEEMWIFPKGAETLNVILLLVTDGPGNQIKFISLDWNTVIYITNTNARAPANEK